MRMLTRREKIALAAKVLAVRRILSKHKRGEPARETYSLEGCGRVHGPEHTPSVPEEVLEAADPSLPVSEWPLVEPSHGLWTPPAPQAWKHRKARKA
jgi:hypothetical protein